MSKNFFNDDAVKRISSVVLEVERKRNFAPEKRKFRKKGNNAKNGITFQAPSNGIPSAFDLSAGGTICDVLESDEGGTWVKVREQKIFNFSDQAICVDGLRLGWAISTASGYIAISQLCNDERTFRQAEDNS